MSLKATVRQSGEAAIVDLDGKITLGDGSGTLRDTIRDMMAKGHKTIVLNLGNVSYIDSAGLGELVGAYTTVQNQGGNLRLLNLQKKIQDLMQITKLYTIFQVYDDEASAVA